MRDSRSLIFEGRPGWTLHSFLWVVRRVREFIPDLSVRVFLTGDAPAVKNDDPQVVYGHRKMLDEIGKGLDREWITVFQRAAHPEDFSASAIWCYPTHFPEAGAGAVADSAQRYGAIPVFNPIGPLREVFAGIPIYGIPAIDPLVRTRYACEIVRLMSQPELQQQIRTPMMQRAHSLAMEAA